MHEDQLQTWHDTFRLWLQNVETPENAAARLATLGASEEVIKTVLARHRREAGAIIEQPIPVGITDVENGQPILTDATVFGVAASVRFPLPDLVTTAVAESAAGGTLDAALVEIRNALITDAFQGTDSFWIEATDGSGVVQIRLRDFLGFNTANFASGRTITVGRGLLVPADSGTNRWVFTPRDPGDMATVP